MRELQMDGNTPVLVGSGGRLGRRIARAWRAAGQPFVGASSQPGGDILWSAGDPPPPCPAARGQAVIVLSGAVPGGGDGMAANLDRARASVAAARSWGAVHVFLMSSAAIYGRAAGPLDETVPPAPVGDYGRAKAAMEAALAGPGITALRLANVGGASEPWTTFAREGLARLPRFADGSTLVRSAIGPVTLARILAELAGLARSGADIPGLLNVALPRPFDLAELARAAGVSADVTPAPDDLIPRVALVTDRLAGLVDLPLHDAASLQSEIDATEGDAP